MGRRGGDENEGSPDVKAQRGVEESHGDARAVDGR